MSNLSSLLEGTAQAYPDRTAVVLGDTRLTYAQVDAGANQVANLLVSRGIGPGDKVALSCAEPAVLPDRLLRHPQGRRDGRAAQHPAQGPRGRLPPRRLRREGLLLLPGHRRAADRRGGTRGLPADRRLRALLRHHRRPRRRVPDRGRGDARAGPRGPVAGLRERRRGRRRHRRHPLHVRHHRPAQGCRADAPQHDQQRPLERLALRRRRREPRHPALRAAAVPLVRPDGDHERRLRLRRHRRAAPALRGGTGPGADGQGGRHLLRRRPDDVLGTPRGPRRLRGGRQEARRDPACRRGRRLRPAGGGPQGVRAPLRRHDPRGLRPLRDVAGRQLLGVGRAGAGRLHRQAHPGGRDEADQPRARGARGHRGRTGRRRRDRDQGPQHHEGLLRPRPTPPTRRSSTAGSAPATSDARTRTAGTTSSTGPRT